MKNDKNSKDTLCQRMVASAYSSSEVIGADANEAIERGKSIGLGSGMSKELYTRIAGSDIGAIQQKRDVTVAGGAPVPQDALSILPGLTANMVLTQAGARGYFNLKGDTIIPTEDDAGTVSWTGETGAGSDGGKSFKGVSRTPHRLYCSIIISRQLLFQISPENNELLKVLIANSIRPEVERVALVGTGLNDEPTGLLYTTDVQEVEGGVNGLAPDLDTICDLEDAVALENADVGNLAYVTNTKVRRKLKKTVVNTDMGMAWSRNSKLLNSYPGLITNNAPSNLDKGTSVGVCSPIFFGDWAQLGICSFGDTLDFLVDPYSLAKNANVIIHCQSFWDINVANAKALAVNADALTV